MRKYSILFLALLLVLTTACQGLRPLHPSPSPSQSFGAEEDEGIVSTDPDDCPEPMPEVTAPKDSLLPPGFTLDPDQPDRYVSIEEWHG